MLTFDRGENRFAFRVAGIAIRNNDVLLHRSEADSFWALPGGRVEFGESSADSLRREMQEEVGLDVRVDRLLWVVENFFDYAGRHYHEIGHYYLMSLPDSDLLRSTTPVRGFEGEAPLIFQWHPLSRLGKQDVDVRPTFLADRLGSLPMTPQHVVHRDT